MSLLEGEYVPSTQGWVRDQVEDYESSGGERANTLRGGDDPIVLAWGLVISALIKFILIAAVVYFALIVPMNYLDDSRNLLPYQTLAAALPQADQEQFRGIREQLLAAEAHRARTARWPDPAALSLPGSGYTWTRLERGVITNYLGRPREASQPAWLLEIQEPEPGMAPDPAPNDEQHHRLPDGTTLHIFVWMHRFGGDLPVEFVPQPQNTGWVEVFAVVPNPVYAIRR